MGKNWCSETFPEGILQFSTKQRTAQEADIECRSKNRGRLAILGHPSSPISARMREYNGRCMTATHTIGVKFSQGKYSWIDGTPAQLDRWRLKNDYVSSSNTGVQFGSLSRNSRGVITFYPSTRKTPFVCFQPTSTYTTRKNVATTTGTTSSNGITSYTGSAALTSPLLTPALHVTNLSIAVGVISSLFILATFALVYVIVCRRKQRCHGRDVTGESAKASSGTQKASTAAENHDVNGHIYHTIDDVNHLVRSSDNYNHIYAESRDQHPGVYVQRVVPAANNL